MGQIDLDVFDTDRALGDLAEQATYLGASCTEFRAELHKSRAWGESRGGKISREHRQLPARAAATILRA